MDPCHEGTYLHDASWQYVLVQVKRVESLVSTHTPVLAQYVLVCLLWGIVLYTAMAALR